MINYADFIRLLNAVSDCKDLDAYIAEEAGSVPGVDEDTASAIALLTAIWTMARDGLSIKSIASACDLSMRHIALELGIPLRTVENWSAGSRSAPGWSLQLIAYAALSLTCE